ncbi:hypothetical protein [Clostridium beijerinckii]|uniref:hypothetical protein n=1 Tax=Clostridium beijerinckii TaxID=1520 RepID=UPI0003D3204A|nr:hypothetical protein [Clostridium beijerinckii]ALB46991.1 hypothetical protein X276_17950 [Clostridium beijerinckii NRRL B-598]
MARPRKLSDDELLKIVEKYIIEKPYIVSLKYTDLAKYSQEELGIENVTYQDFSRNKNVQRFVELHKKQKDMTTYIRLNSDKLEKLNFNVENIVEKYKNDSKQLKVILKVFKEGYDKAFDTLIKYDDSDKKNRNIIKEQEKAIKELKDKNKELRAKLSQTIENSKQNKDTERLKWMYLLVKDMINKKNCRIEANEDIIEILKNFGYLKDDIANVENILNNELKNSEEKIHLEENETLSEEKVISMNENKLKLPNFMKER